MARLWSALVLLWFVAPRSQAQQPVSCRTLLAEMTSLSRLCRLPSVPYSSRQAASYSGYPRQDFTPDSACWWYNNDQGWFVRRDSAAGEWVLLEAQGPGVIERIWSPNPVSDTLRFYLDSSLTPAWSLPMAALLRASGPIPAPLAGERARGCNLYFPIPYGRRCKLALCSGDPKYLYYHVGYRTYLPGVPIESFRPDALQDLAGEIAQAAQTLADTASWTASVPRALTRELQLTPGAFATIVLNDGPSAITDLRFTVHSANPGAFVRGTALTITWDNANTPQVDVPLGDFFASSPRVTPYRTLPAAILADSTLACRWVMPYRQRATITLANHSGSPGVLAGSIATEPFLWDDSSMYFHAYWRQDTAVYTASRPEGAWFMVSPPRDHRFVHIRGAGLYVGTVLQIRSELNDWWGEGDERIYVDSEPFPRFMGTGTEDYFGYGYSTMTAFEHAYHAQPYSEGFRGFTTNLRWHIADPIPFSSELVFDMEIQTAYRPATLDYGRACFFYARPGAWSDHDGLDGQDLFLREPATPVAAPINHAIAPAPAAQARALYDLAGRRVTSQSLPSAPRVLVQRSDGRSRAVVEGGRE